MTAIEDFKYVDFASAGQPGFRNNTVHVDNLPGLIQQYAHTDCYSTYFLFDKGLLDYASQNHGSVAGYQGQCYAHYLPFDVDSPDLAVALQTTREIGEYLVDACGIPDDGLAVYYSGKKGFHLSVGVSAFGETEPGENLPKILGGIRRSIVKQAKVKHPEAVDFAISDRLRLLRLPNTRNTKSGLYKVPLGMDELMSWEMEEIKEIAQKPRPVWLTDESGLLPRHHIDPVPAAVELYECCVESGGKGAHVDLPDPSGFLARGGLNQALCEAELRLYLEGAPEGARSAACVRLASRMRSAGYGQGEAFEMLESFANRCRPPFEPGEARRIASLAYRSGQRGYQFGCGTGNGEPVRPRRFSTTS